MAVEIKYKNSLVASLGDGQRATLQTKDTYMEDDVIVEASGFDGLAINGLVEQYKVAAGANVNAGDFVEFVRASTNGTFTSGEAEYLSTDFFDENRAIVAYLAEGKVKVQALDFSNGAVQAGNILSFSPGNEDVRGVSIGCINETNAILTYADSYEPSTYLQDRDGYARARCIKADGINLSSSGSVLTFLADTGSYSASDIYSLSTITFKEDEMVLAVCMAYLGKNTNKHVYRAKTLYLNSSGELSAGAETQFAVYNTSSNTPKLSLLSNNKILVSYQDTSRVFSTRIMSISGSAISLGGSVSFGDATSTISAVPLSDNLAIFTYNTSSGGRLCRTSISGTNITTLDSHSAEGRPISAWGKAINDSITFIIYRDGANSSLGKITTLRVSDDAIQENSSAFFTDGPLGQVTIVPITSNVLRLLYDDGRGRHMTILVDEDGGVNKLEEETYVQPAYSLQPNVGVAKTSGAEGEMVEVVRVHAKYNVSVAPSNVTPTPMQSYIYEDESTSFQVAPNTGYELPDTISAPSNATYTWTKDTGTLFVENPKTDLSFVIKGIQILLGTPVITLENSTVSWSAIENATSYKVYSNGSLLTTATETALDLSTLITKPGEYIIKIIAAGAPYGNSTYSNEVVYNVPLTAPTLAISEDILTITDTSGLATSYDLYVNDIFDSNTIVATIDLSTTSLEPGTYNISAVAKAEGYIDSARSASIKYTAGKTLTVETETNDAGGETYTITTNDYTTEANEAGGETYTIGG